MSKPLTLNEKQIKELGARRQRLIISKNIIWKIMDDPIAMSVLASKIGKSVLAVVAHLWREVEYINKEIDKINAVLKEAGIIEE